MDNFAQADADLGSAAGRTAASHCNSWQDAPPVTGTPVHTQKQLHAHTVCGIHAQCDQHSDQAFSIACSHIKQRIYMSLGPSSCAEAHLRLCHLHLCRQPE
jgi:hypothetical protein